MLRNKSVVLLALAVLACTLFGFVHTANAQVLFGSASGTVTDPSGAAVPKAHVSSISKATGAKRETDADASGHYTLTDLSPGLYDVTVTAGGFKPLTQTDVSIGANVVTNANFNLQVGSISEKVTVEAEAVTLQTEKTDVHTEIPEKAILEMPLNQYRNYQTLINLVPGATPGQFQNAIADSPERALTTNINGTNRNNNNTRVDGAADVFVWLPHHTVYVPPAETIQEVNVSTNNFDPEQGMTGGAAITVITKSGSNQFHGVLFEYHEDQALRARQYFETPAVQPKKGTSILNDMGGTFGGPIKKDKLFFFGSWDGTFERDARNTGLVTVPSAPLLAGDFSGVLGDYYCTDGTSSSSPCASPVLVTDTNNQTQQARAGMIFSPQTGSANGTGRQQYAGNIVPSIDPIATKIIGYLPPPNVPGAGDINNYFFSATQRLNRNNIDAKVDWNRTTNHTIFAKYSTMKSVFHGVPSLGRAIGDCACDGGLGDFHSHVQLVTVGHTLTLSPTLVIDGNVGFTRMSEYGKTPDYGTNIGSDVLGLPGTNNGSDLRSSGFPYFAVSGFADIGNPEGWNPAFRNDWSFTSSHNVRWSKGNHQISAGTDIVHHHLNHWQPELGSGPRGEFDFDGAATALAPDPNNPNSNPPPPNQFNAWAQFLLGLPGGSVSSGLGKSDQFIKATAKEWQFGFFFGDRYRVSNKLTLNLGLRYEYYPLMTRDSVARFDRLDFTTLNVLLGGIGGNPEHLGVTTSKKLFAPRVGLAYQVSDKMVVRSGFGITVDPLPLARPLRGFYPFTVGSNFEGVNGFAPAASFSPLATPLPSGAIPVGIPAICCPDISSGVIPLPPQALERSVGPGELKRGYIESWNLIVERKLPGEFLGSVGYVGTQTVRAFGDLDVNSAPPDPVLSGPSRQPYNLPQFGNRTASTLYWQGFLSANYHSLQASLNRQFKNGFMVKGAYTWSKAIDWTDDDGWAGLSWNDPAVLRRNRAPAGYNTPQIFQMSYIYELPFGSGKRFANSGAASKIAGGWQTSGIFSAVSGQPFQLTGPGAPLNAVDQLQTPDQVGPVRKLGGIGSGNPFYDPSAFVAVATPGTYGNVGRNSLRGPSSINFDFSLFRTFKPLERLEVQFRADAANLFNTPHFNNPNGDVTSSDFLTITSARNDERQFRFGLRLAF